MTVSTTNLGLTTYNVVADGSSLFLAYRTDVAGSPTASNLQKIDNWAGETTGSIVDLQSRNLVVSVPASRVSGNYFLASPISEVSAYLENMFIGLSLDNSITGSATLQINSLGIKGLKKIDGLGNATDLQSGDLRTQKNYLFRYDGTQWIWVGATAGDQITILSTSPNYVSINPSGSTLVDSGVPIISGCAGEYNLVETDTYGQVSGGSTIAYENILLNGGFDKYSRNMSPATGSSVIDDNYCFDRWILLTQTAAGSCLQVDGNTNHPNAMRIQQPQVTAQRLAVEQIVEYKDSILFREQSVVFSGYAKCSVTEDVYVAILNSGSQTADVVDSDCVQAWTSSATPTSFIKSSFNVLASAYFSAGSSVFTPFSVSAYVPVSTNNLIVIMWTRTTLNQDVTLDFVGCGLYPGKTSPPMQPFALQEDPFLVRYARFIGNEVGDLHMGMVTDSGSSTFVIPFETEMRSAPTAITTHNLGWFNVVTASGSGVVSSVEFDNATKKSIRLNVVSGSHGESAGDVCFLNCLGGSGLIYLEAEL